MNYILSYATPKLFGPLDKSCPQNHSVLGSGKSSMPLRLIVVQEMLVLGRNVLANGLELQGTGPANIINCH